MSRRTPKIVIARIGGIYSYSDIVARKIFGAPENNSKIRFARHDLFNDCLEAVRGKKADYAVVPVRNTVITDISDTGQKLPVVQMASEMKLHLKRKRLLPVPHVIASYGRLEDVDTVYSKQQALDQCTKFCNQHNLDMQSCYHNGTTISDTSDAARYVASLDLSYYAVICSAQAARYYGLRKLYNGNIADVENNATLFHVYARKP